MSPRIETFRRAVGLALFRPHFESGLSVAAGMTLLGFGSGALLGVAPAVAIGSGALCVSILDQPGPIREKPRYLPIAVVATTLVSGLVDIARGSHWLLAFTIALIGYVLATCILLLSLAPHEGIKLMQFIRSVATAKADLPFSDAVRVDGVIYLSGQLGAMPGTMSLASGGIEGETRQMMENIRAVLASCGLGFDDIFKCTVMLADMKQWPDFNKVYVTYFNPDRLPTRSAFGTNGLALGAAVEMECWAKAR